MFSVALRRRVGLGKAGFAIQEISCSCEQQGTVSQPKLCCRGRLQVQLCVIFFHETLLILWPFLCAAENFHGNMGAMPWLRVGEKGSPLLGEGWSPLELEMVPLGDLPLGAGE